MELFQRKKFKWPKKCSQSLARKEMQIKTTLRFCLTPVRVTIINNTINNKFGEDVGKKEILIHCWWECKLVQPFGKQYGGFLKN
jgi:hypothetical protein